MSVIQKCSSNKSTTSRVSLLSKKRIPSMSMSSVRSFESSTKNNFRNAYTINCTKYKIRPMQCVKINSKANSIEILGDRMKTEDWQAAMEALNNDISTHYICIKNKRYTENLEMTYDTFSSAMAAPKNLQASSTQYVTSMIASTIYNVLVMSQALVCLELENVLFDNHALESLISGVSINKTLQHLSLAHGRIGDRACLTLCRILRYKPNIRSVDLTDCSLSSESGKYGLVDVIKKQQYKRHEECWAHSLRSRTANPDIMHGLRRLTLNDNPGLGDDGVAELFETLKDDLFVKAVDLQNCGLTDRSAQLVLSTLLINDTLIVLDVRKNALISSTALEMIMGRLYENNVDKSETSLWKWTKLERKIACGSSSTLAR